jgi:uncharacterized SAM-binding protein YcdF (DUF218 family)
MMFYISKIVWGVLQPSSLLLVLFAGGVLFALLGRAKAATRLFVAGTVLYMVFGFSPLANWMLGVLEIEAKAEAAASLDGAAGIIVLGGAVDNSVTLASPAPHLNESADRMTEAVRLAVRYPALPVFFSGGKGELSPREETETEAAFAVRFFEGFNLPASRITFEDRSRNTFENAVESARKLHPQPGQKWILITSAFHMPRAKALFEAQGFELLAKPVDFRTNGLEGWWRPFPRASEGLRRLDVAAKEWIGIAAARLTGQISWSRTSDAGRASSASLCHNYLLPHLSDSLASGLPHPLA